MVVAIQLVVQPCYKMGCPSASQDTQDSAGRKPVVIGIMVKGHHAPMLVRRDFIASKQFHCCVSRFRELYHYTQAIIILCIRKRL